MKLIYLYTIGDIYHVYVPIFLFMCPGVAENNQFFDWKESDYKAYEDSLLKALYPRLLENCRKSGKVFTATSGFCS